MEDWAERFRRHLRAASIDRPELFEDTPTHKQITLYDLRATGITCAACAKDYGPAIQEAAGHEEHDATDRYIRTAQVLQAASARPSRRSRRISRVDSIAKFDQMPPKYLISLRPSGN